MSDDIFNGTGRSAREVEAVLDLHPIGRREDRENRQGTNNPITADRVKVSSMLSIDPGLI
jgi:hypothetical protein